MDLFNGNESEELHRREQMHRAREKALAGLRTKCEEAERRAEAHPDDEQKQRAAKRARDAYESLLRHHEKHDETPTKDGTHAGPDDG